MRRIQLRIQSCRSAVLRAALAGHFTLHDADPLCSAAIVDIANVLPGRQNFRVSLTDTDAIAKINSASDIGESASWTFAMRSREALAMLTMYFLSLGDATNGQPTYLWGGLNYLQGEPDIFWSMVVYFLRDGAPIPPPLASMEEAASTSMRDADAWDVGAPFRDAVALDDYTALAAEYQSQFDAAAAGSVQCMWFFKQAGCKVGRACPCVHPPLRQRPSPRAPYAMPRRCMVELSGRTAGPSRVKMVLPTLPPDTDPEAVRELKGKLAEFERMGGDAAQFMAAREGAAPPRDMLRFPLGARVVLHSLSADAFNGLHGEVVQEFDVSTQRCGVRLDPPSDPNAVKNIKSANLKREALSPEAGAILGTRVVLHSLKAAKFNGKHGEIIAAVSSVTGRCGVRLDGGSDVKQLRLDNLALEPGILGASLNSFSNRYNDGQSEEGNNVTVTHALNFDTCANCGATEGPFKCCSRCQNVRYCSSKCQKADWKVHKVRCKALRAQRVRVKAKQKADPRPTTNMYSAASGTGFACLLRGERNSFMCGTNPGDNPQDFELLSDLGVVDGFCLACGPYDDLEFAKRAVAEHGTLIITRSVLPGVGFRPLDWAARCGNFEIAEWLLTTAPECAAIGTPVGWACYTNKVKLAKMLVAHGADDRATSPVLFTNRSPLAVACENAQLLAIQWLINERGYDAAGSRCLAYLESAGKTPAADACRRWLIAKMRADGRGFG